MISGEICGVIFFLAKKPTFDQCIKCTKTDFIGMNSYVCKLVF